MDRWAQRGVTVGELRDGTAARRRPWVTAYFRRAGAQHLVRPVQAQAAVPAPASGRRWLGRRRRDAATAPSLTTTTPLLRSVTVPAGTWRAVPAPLGHGRQQIPAAASMKMTGVTGALHRTVPSAGANLPRPRQTRRVRRTASALATRPIGPPPSCSWRSPRRAIDPSERRPASIPPSRFGRTDAGRP